MNKVQIRKNFKLTELLWTICVYIILYFNLLIELMCYLSGMYWFNNDECVFCVSDVNCAGTWHNFYQIFITEIYRHNTLFELYRAVRYKHYKSTTFFSINLDYIFFSNLKSLKT